ncbi:hypothetical protein K439DRAFT_1517548 [Ramaria rubella]|nr:hypothetical protein K439DRAFT_1517548 [Ramaria rubella]
MSNMMPICVLKHSQIIQQREMKASAAGVSLGTEPPPMSADGGELLGLILVLKAAQSVRMMLVCIGWPGMVLVQRQGMMEADVHGMRYKALRVAPDTNKFNVDVDTEAALKFDTLIPPEGIGVGEHLVSKGNLLVVAGGEEANRVHHTDEGACSVGTTTEAKDADTVAIGVCTELKATPVSPNGTLPPSCTLLVHLLRLSIMQTHSQFAMMLDVIALGAVPIENMCERVSECEVVTALLFMWKLLQVMLSALHTLSQHFGAFEVAVTVQSHVFAHILQVAAVLSALHTLLQVSEYHCQALGGVPIEDM